MPAVLTPDQFATQFQSLYGPFLYEVRRRTGCDEETAADLVADARLLALSRLDLYDADTGASGFARWAGHLLHLTLRRFRHRQQRQPETVPLDTLSHALPADPPAPPLCPSDLKVVLAITPLTANQRYCVLRRAAGDTQKQMARSLEVSQPVISEILQAADAKLARRLPFLAAEADWVLFALGSQVSVYHKPTHVWSHTYPTARRAPSPDSSRYDPEDDDAS